jgi:hypothetical protein
MGLRLGLVSCANRNRWLEVKFLVLAVMSFISVETSYAGCVVRQTTPTVSVDDPSGRYEITLMTSPSQTTNFVATCAPGPGFDTIHWRWAYGTHLYGFPDQVSLDLSPSQWGESRGDWYTGVDWQETNSSCVNNCTTGVGSASVWAHLEYVPELTRATPSTCVYNETTNNYSVTVDINSQTNHGRAAPIRDPSGYGIWYYMDPVESNPDINPIFAKLSDTEFTTTVSQPGDYKYNLKISQMAEVQAPEGDPAPPGSFGFYSANTLPVSFTCSQKIDVHFFQVTKDPKIPPPFDGNSIVDLVSGKNADVVATVDSETDVSKSTLILCGKTYKPKANVSDGNGNVTFELSPVPPASECAGTVTADLQIKDEDNDLLGTATPLVQIRETKTIKFGFIPIEIVCPFSQSCSAAPSDVGMANIISKGTPYLNAIYPVAQGGVTWDYYGISYKGTYNHSWNYDEDALTLMMNSSNPTHFQEDGVTKVVGLVSDTYFPYHSSPFVGVSNFEQNSFLVQAGDLSAELDEDWKVLSHEMGHTFCLRWDFNTVSCIGFQDPDTAPIYSHDPNLAQTASGYSVDDLLSEGINLKRGPIANTFSLMNASGTPAKNSVTWWRENEYNQIFGINLSGSRIKSSESGAPQLWVSGTISIDGHFNRTLSYISTSNNFVPQSADGNIYVEVEDINKSILSTYRFNSRFSLEAPSTEAEVKFSLPFTADAVFLNIYKEGVRGMRIGVGTVVIPADTIYDRLQFIPRSSFVGDPDLSMSSLAGAISGYRQKLIDGDFTSAAQFLQQAVTPLLQSSLKDNLQLTSPLDLGKTEMISLSTASANQLNSIPLPPGQNPISPVVTLTGPSQSAAGSQVSIQIAALTEPSNEKYTIFSKVYFDGIIVGSDSQAEIKSAKSFPLSIGNHQWVVHSYLASFAKLKIWSAALKAFKSTIAGLRFKISNEKSVTKIADMQRELSLVERRVIIGRTELEEGFTELGQAAELKVVAQ